MHTLTNQIDEQKWLQLLASSPYASPFQSPSFYHFYNSLNTASADVFAVEVAGEYTALVVVTVQQEVGLKAFFSRRGIVYGGILLLNSDDTASISLLLSHLKTFYRRKLIYLEIRNSFNYDGVKQSLEKIAFRYIPWLNYHHNNITREMFRHGMSKGRQRQLKKALGNGVSWREAKSSDDVSDFYGILSDLYAHKVKKPLPSFEFFEKLYHASFAKCLLVIHDDKVIGGVMCPIDSTTLYELYICGLDRKHPNVHPSIVAMWAMVDYATRHNVNTIDLMGAGQANKSNSVRDFKARFGGELVEHGRFLHVCQPLLYALGRAYLKLRKVM